MKVVYTAPNRGHHFRYAAALHKAGCLHAFVSGFSRLSPLAKAPELNGRLHRADLLQTVYLGSLKAGLPESVSSYLAYLAKKQQDAACRRYVKQSDVFLYYNGSGLNSGRCAQKRGAVSIVEAVNCHVVRQEEILQSEHGKWRLPWKPFPAAEVKRRVKEYEEADYILLPSEFVKRSFLAKGFAEEKLLKVPYGFAGSSPNTQPEKDDDGFTVLFVGSLSVRKGIRYLLDAFEKITHPRKKLVLTGPDAKDGILDGVRLPENAVLTGVLKGEELAAAYRSADVFCLPSVEEGLALVIGEAVAHGLPVVATHNTGAEDLITHGREGLLVPAMRSDALAQALQQLADEPALRRQMRHHTRQKAQGLNGWDATGEALVKTLRSVYQKAR